MGIEDVRLSVHRMVELSLEISHIFLKKHAYVSGVLLFFFLFYFFLPSIISFLLYIFPFFLCTAILLKIFWTSERYNVQDRTQECDSKSFDKDVYVDKNEIIPTSRRRNYLGKYEGWDSQAGWEEKDMVSWTSPGGISVQNISSMGETRKEIHPSVNASVAESMMRVQEKDRPLMKPEPSLSDLLTFEGSRSQTHKSRGDDESISESSEEVEEEEEETHENGDKAVEWTEDDQKNLMDLGLSELERNKRLESLIAKRRGRKFFHEQVEEDGIPSCPIAKVSVAKHTPFDVPNSYEEMKGFPVPGSAPSVLLPMRNPFDLPYDPFEEKPNLMTDSFHQEFTAVNQRELSYCRHESFCFGPSFPLESKQIMQEAKQNPLWASDCFGNSRFGRPSDFEKEDHEWPAESLLFEGREMKEELQGNDREIHLQNSDTNSSLSSENLGEISNGDKAGTPTMNDPAHQSMPCSTQSSITVKEPAFEFSPSASNGNRIDDCFSAALKAASHASTYSIASDMQVEVSEISSPPITFDGTDSATEGESFTYDGDIEKDMGLDSEETWESDIYRGIQNETDTTEAIVVNNVDLWLSDERSKDATPKCNPFDATQDSTDRTEKSSFMSNDITDPETEKNGGENNSFISDSMEVNGVQDHESSEKSSERDKILDPIKEKEKEKEKEKPSTSDGNAELRKPSEDEESSLESEDSELPQIFGEPVILGEHQTVDSEQVASNSSSSSTPNFTLQERIPAHPISSSAFSCPTVTEMEYGRQSSSSSTDREASPCSTMENHLVVGSAAQPTHANDSKMLQTEQDGTNTHSSENSQEEFMDRIIDPSHIGEGAEDVDANGDAKKDGKELPLQEESSKSMKELECESETQKGYEADLDPTTPTVRRTTGLPPSSTSGEGVRCTDPLLLGIHPVILVQEKLIPVILPVPVAEEGKSHDFEADHCGTNGDEATNSGPLKPKEEESESMNPNHAADRLPIAIPTEAEKDSEVMTQKIRSNMTGPAH